MRNKILKLWLFLSLLIIFTRAHAQTPIEINNIMAGYTDSLYKLGQEWGTKFNEVYKTKKFGELFSYRTGMQNYVDQSIPKVQKMKDVNGSRNLQSALLNLLYYEKKILMTAFLPFEKLSENSSDKEIKNALDNLTAISKDEEIKVKEIAKAQEAYAAKNGFKIGN